jgi:glucose-1-phosphate thymidylyltransferase
MVEHFPRDKWRAVIMAGGRATRFYPVSAGVNKHLLPVFDKPMIYYPLTTLMMGGLRDFIILSTPEATPQLESLLGDGSAWGVSIAYRVQPKPAGIADAFNICGDDLDGMNTAMILGDNIFYGHRLPEAVQAGARIADTGGAMVYAYEVGDPRAFGVVELDGDGRAVGLVEKPENPKSNLAVPGLYFYDQQATALAKTLTPSGRGELEITDLNRWYLEQETLQVERLGRGIAWLDGGTPDALAEATSYIRAIEARQGLRAACPEEVAFRRGFIDKAGFVAAIETLPKCDYRAYLEGVAARV